MDTNDVRFGFVKMNQRTTNSSNLSLPSDITN
jgi:hypothetical protein